MSALTKILSDFLLISSLIILFCNFCFAQKNVDLDIRSESSTETARGGENFSYTITVSNIGLAKATNVILTTEPDNLIEITSNALSKGTCEEYISGNYARKSLRCRLEYVDVGEIITIVVGVKVTDFGDISNNTIGDAPSISPFFKLPSSTINSEPVKERNPISSTYIDAEEAEENKENNRAKAFAELLPSKNIPPRVQIISPKNELSFIKPLNKQLEIPIVIKAFDVDGNIEKVTVDDDNSRFKFVVEDNQTKFSIDGKTYTKEELELAEKDEGFYKSFENKANLIAKDTYTYTAKNFIYGRNIIRIMAFDEGGRSSSQSIEFDIKRDAAIEIVSPKLDQVFAPNSTIKIETISKINDSQSSQLRLVGTQNVSFYYDSASIPLLQQVSKVGNSFKHQYIWKNVPEGIHNLRVLLFDGENFSQYEAMTTIIVAEPRVIKIVSLKNGQEFEAGKNIEIKVEARDKKGQIVTDDLELFIDGKSYDEKINNSLCGGCFPKSFIWQSRNIESGTYTIQIVAKYQNKIKSGESEIITIKVK